MISEKQLLWETSEYNYPAAFGFVPNIVSYLHEDTKKRPCIIVVPGGGYRVVSPTEGEIVALEFYRKGYNTFVCTYTTDISAAAPLEEQPMRDLSRAIRYIRANSERFRIAEDKLIVCGFSAGGHLCGSVCVHYADVADENPKFSSVNNRPDAAILAYPVITSGKYAHSGSFEALFGMEPEKEKLEYMSLEKQVTSDTPPCFLWQTVTDQTVPVENSYLFAKACKEHQIPFAHHVFSKGKHGLSLANEIWAKGEVGGTYTIEQVQKMLNAAERGEIVLSKGLQGYICEKMSGKMPEEETVEEVAVWPVLADRWLRSVLDI